MIKIEAVTLEEAYKNAASELNCSVTELKIEVVQTPSSGFLGMFKKSAIIVAVKEQVEEKIVPVETVVIKEQKVSKKTSVKKEVKEEKAPPVENIQKKKEVKEEKIILEKVIEKDVKKEIKKEVKKNKPKEKKKKTSQTILNDTIMPASFVSMQDEDEEIDDDVSSYLADYDDEEDEEEITSNISTIAKEVQEKINTLFDFTCFNIETVDVSVYDENTLLVEFKGDDAALLIGKEGYRYKALSYMIFNWINTKYQIQLRLEIAEFLKNQEESVSKYLVGVCENINKDGKAQTKILDGVLIQIALKELRDKYPEKYVVIRSTRDGLKYIIINDYHSN